MEREKQITVSRHFYKLTVNGEKKVIKFPATSIPFLNQTMDYVRYHTVMDPVDSRWSIQIKTFKALTKIWYNVTTSQMGKFPFDTLSHYHKVYLSHQKFIEVSIFLYREMVEREVCNLMYLLRHWQYVILSCVACLSSELPIRSVDESFVCFIVT